MREDTLFMRNNFDSVGKWGFALNRKQEMDLSDIQLIACSDTKADDRPENTVKGVHFFVDDYRFTGIYDHPERTLKKYSQYSFLLTPDFSLYADMDLWRQMESVAKNRWIGAYWQRNGLKVIPTIAWSSPRSYEFCFDGVERNGTVAVGMIGCKKNKLGFLRGYNTMLEKIEPEHIIVFGEPFDEMQGDLIPVDYRKSKKAVR